MQVYNIDPLRDSRWVEFVKHCPQASVFHTREWLDSIRRTYGYQPVVFTTSPPGGQIRNGLVFCPIRSWLTGSRMVSLPFSDHCEPLADTDEELDFLAKYLHADMEHRDWTYLEIRPINGRFDKSGQKAGFCPANSYFFHRLDLRPSLDEIFQSLHKNSVQRRIQRAERAGIVYKCGQTEELLRDFYNLLVLTRGRHHLPPQPYVWFRNLIACMGEALEIRLAYQGTTPIAAVLTLRFRKTVYYKYGCSDAMYHKLGAMPALLWRTIQESKAAGSEDFDLGRSDCENKGLVAFKDHLTRGRTRLVYWRYPPPRHPSTSEGWKLRMVKRAFACMPNRLLGVTGRLIYRHIG
jgi:hypothetical protein